MKNIFNTLFNNKSKAENGNDNQITDSFADYLSLDLKRSANEAILSALKKNQDKYLSSILKQSSFPIESLIFHPLDHDTAIQTEEFFRIHNEIDPEFEKNFFAGLILKEYRTEIGACAHPAENLSASIQPNTFSTDNPTIDESYQISLRGNKKRFSAEVKLGVLKGKKQTPQHSNKIQFISNEEIDKTSKINPSTLKSQGTSINLDSNTFEATLSIKIMDENGEKDKTFRPPLIIGRETSENAESYVNKLNINGKYISRNQMVVFEIIGKLYCFIPEDASLTGVTENGIILEKLKLYEIDSQGIYVTFGQTIDTQQTTVDILNQNLYPRVQIKKISEVQNIHQSTPIPKIKR